MILEGSPSSCQPYNAASFTVTVMYNWGGVIPTSPFVTAAEIGLTLTVKIKHWPSGNECWGQLKVEDKLPPQLICPPDTILACTVAPDTSITGVPTVTDCSDFTLNFYSTAQNIGCTGPFSAVVTRTWLAVDEDGFTSTCNQTINIGLPVIADVVFPPRHSGAFDRLCEP
jgi:hypothetical protein